MANQLFTLLFTILIIITGCKNQSSNTQVAAKNTIDSQWLDSIIKKSDSIYSKPYGRTDFVTAFFYFNKKDSSVCQVMKDSASNIRQVIIAKNDIRTFFAQYYPNGQLMAKLPLDKYGQYYGECSYFFEDGTIESSGSYEHGLKKRDWKKYDDKGNLIVTEQYDDNGQLLKK